MKENSMRDCRELGSSVERQYCPPKPQLGYGEDDEEAMNNLRKGPVAVWRSESPSLDENYK